ncbi:DUF2290 domain-containing protein [Tardiphaga alba]|uniref:DUF2290 domain-containing protein n=1 Tax=Tardiphaga alba TaxID=340268 RepID=A0ABX8A2P6_9BRAD|nr:DUF2290 domain-containing protein [Tardiphaga alba]QUS37809.1 DUF2290 domain-containing protein [Tardiphaga alba]
MALPEAIAREIKILTADLIEVGLSVDQNFPSLRDFAGGIRDLGFGPSEGLSQTLRNVAYATAYETLKEGRAYNVRLIDGGLMQFLYRFRNDELVTHRLAFFPSPDLLEFQNNPEVYELDEMYGDVLHRNVVTTPLRFDFDRDAFVEVHHPMAHLTIGQYRNCRIPVSGPLSPFMFVNFILKAFYNTAYRLYSGEIREHAYDYVPTITAAETRFVHMQIGAPA